MTYVAETATIMELAGASPEAIRYHYDFGTPFFQLWLDHELVYSAARWNMPFSNENQSTLEAAQTAKIDFHLNAINASECTTVLDIGCGWGALLRRAVQHYNVAYGLGLTLSADQQEWIALQRWPNVEVLLESYERADLQHQVDGIVSIGAFEHFVRPDYSAARKLQIYSAFFERCSHWLPRGRLMSLQTICWGSVSRVRTSTLLPHDIFPESDLPYASEIIEASHNYFELVYVENGRDDYIKTVKEWLARLRTQQATVVERFGGTATFEYYERYLRRALAGFAKRRMTLHRIVLRRL